MVMVCRFPEMPKQVERAAPDLRSRLDRSLILIGIVEACRPRHSLPTGAHCGRRAQHELAMGRGTNPADTDERLVAIEINAQQTPWPAGVTILVQEPGFCLTHESIQAETLHHDAAALGVGLSQ